MEDVGYTNTLAGYPSFVFQDFESCLRTESDLVGDDLRLILKEYISNFITYELQPVIYISMDLSDALVFIIQPDYLSSNSEIVLENDDIIKKTKLVVKSGTIAIRFDEKAFLSTILGFTSGWDFKHYNEYNSQKTVNLITTKKYT